MKRLSGILALVSVVVFTGCSTQKAWVYRANSYPAPPPNQLVGQKVAAVLPFEDGRPSENKNALFAYMIPLVPFGWADFNAPEGSQMHVTTGMWVNYKPSEDFAKALATELRSLGIFKEAYFDFKKGSSDYAIQGKILNTRYGGRLFSYGFSVYGPLLWFIGLPAGTTENELSVELSCLDSRSNKILFAKTYQAVPRSDISFLYVLKNDFNYGEMLAEVYKQFCQDVGPALSEH